MTTTDRIESKCKELFELLKQRKPDATRCHIVLLELRQLSDLADKEHAEIPIGAFITMGAELRMACFDMFLGLMAATLGVVLPNKIQ